MKIKEQKSCDRLSELPDLLIFHIFWYLPMREVVRTTILSLRWETLWTTTPYLNFEDLKMETDTDRVRSFVNRALILWRGTRIRKFKIDLGEHLEQSLNSDIDFWLSFATKYGVEDLVAYLDYGDYIIQDGGVSAIEWTREEMYWALQCLYSCSSLRKLTLFGCNLHTTHRNVYWNELKELRIIGYLVSADLVKKVLCGSPQLELLVLSRMENHENLSIQSTSLKYLHVHKYLYFLDDDPSVDTELRIETPKLDILEISGVPYSKCLIDHIPFATHATISFENEYSHHMFSGNDFVGETLRQILPAIQYVDGLTLSDWCIKALGAMKSQDMLSPFPYVNVLELQGCFEEHKQIVHLLEIFPEMETLILEHKKPNRQFHGGESLDFEADFPYSFLQELIKVVVTWDEVDDYTIFPFIETLLLYANHLEKMVFRFKETTPPSNTLVPVLKKLMRMPRSSPVAELILL